MKKRILLVLGLILTLSFTGCGDKEEASVVDDAEESLVKEEDTEGIVPQTVENKDAVEEDTGEAQTAEGEDPRNTFTDCPRDEKWDSAEHPEQCLQLEDIFFRQGMTAAEAVAEIEASEFGYACRYDEDYEYRYDPEMLLNKGDVYRVAFMRAAKTEEWNDKYAIGIIVISYKDGLPLRDCILIKMGDFGYPVDNACRYIDGLSYNDLEKLGYEGLTPYADTVFKGYIHEYEEGGRHTFSLPLSDIDSSLYKYENNGEYVIKFSLPEDAEIIMYVTGAIRIDYNTDGTIMSANMHLNANCFDKETGEYIEGNLVNMSF